MDEEVRVFGVCEECGSEITEDYYCDDEGICYCSCECAMEHYGLYKIEI